MGEPPFWRRKPLSQMTRDEWESLCDGCGKCCLHKLEDEDTNEIFYTDVACRLLDLTRCRCKRYRERHELVPGCAHLGPDRLDELRTMPSTCAYRLLHEGRDLPWWHPLVSGTPRTVHDAAASVLHRVLTEQDVHEDELEQRVVSWPA
jgi:uncharacterized cysteine cluster protein YcgN (CxxCxxCC family)